MPKKYLILALTLVLIVAGVTFLFFINNKTYETRKRTISPSEKQRIKEDSYQKCKDAKNLYQCYTLESINKESEIPCLLLKKVSDKEKCLNELVALASIKKKKEICDSISNDSLILEKSKIMCYGEVSYSKNDLGVCDSLKGKAKFFSLDYRNACFSMVANQCIMFWLNVIRYPNPAPGICKSLMKKLNLKNPDELHEISRRLEWTMK